MKLSAAVNKLGYSLLIDKNMHNRDDILGNPYITGTEEALICQNNVICVLDDSWDYSYSVSHEIAEYEYNFQHSEELFTHQANILAYWHKLRN